VFPYLILGIALLAGLFLFGRWYAGADPKTITKVLKWVLIAIAALLVVFFIVTRSFNFLLFAGFVLLPLLMRMRAAWQRAKAFTRMASGGKTGGQTSEIETRFLRMSLDHDSGTMSCVVLEGTHQGKDLEQLTQQQQIDLLRTCWEEDAKSAQALEAYLDRMHPDWREQAQYGGEGSGGAGGGDGFADASMSRAEAYRILGLEEGADTAAVKEAHRRLMAAMHPDHGGSTYLAAKINQAKEVLLGEG